MKPGPRPKPRGLRVLHGSRLPENSAPPVPSGGVSKPKWLQGRGAQVWRRLVPELKRLGLATGMDQSTLARYCDMLVRWEDARAWLDKNGDTYTMLKDDGTVRYVAAYPQVSIYRNLSTALLRLEAEYGLTAASRVKLVMPKREEAKDEFANYLRQKPQIG